MASALRLDVQAMPPRVHEDPTEVKRKARVYARDRNGRFATVNSLVTLADGSKGRITRAKDNGDVEVTRTNGSKTTVRARSVEVTGRSARSAEVGSRTSHRRHPARMSPSRTTPQGPTRYDDWVDAGGPQPTSEHRVGEIVRVGGNAYEIMDTAAIGNTATIRDVETGDEEVVRGMTAHRLKKRNRLLDRGKPTLADRRAEDANLRPGTDPSPEDRAASRASLASRAARGGPGGGRTDAREQQRAEIREREGNWDAGDNRGRPRGDEPVDGWTEGPLVTPAVWEDISLEGRPEGTGTLMDPIDVQGDLDRAVTLIGEGKHVRLNQVSEAATVVSLMRLAAADAAERGEKAPPYNLCQISVPDTNLFCAGNKGITRINMPQLSGKDLRPGSIAAGMVSKPGEEANIAPLFREALIERGIAVTSKREPASRLRATQSELDGEKVAGIANAMRTGTMKGPKNASIFVTRDGYVIDGHHRWAANLVVDADDDTLGDVDMRVEMVDMDIGAAIDFANSFAAEYGINQANMSSKPRVNKDGTPAAPRGGDAGGAPAAGGGDAPGAPAAAPAPATPVAAAASTAATDGPPIDVSQPPVNIAQPALATALPAIPVGDGDPSTPGPSGDFTADQARIQDALDNHLAAGTDTTTLYDRVNGREGKYTAAREAQQREVIDHFLNAPGVKSEGKMLVLGGLPGAGKTTFLNSREGQARLGVNLDDYVIVNPDEVKEQMIRRGMVEDWAGLTANEAATLFHAESASVSWDIMVAAVAQGKNVAYDTSLREENHVTGPMDLAREAGNPYDLTTVFIDVPVETATERAVGRYEGGGRYIPLSMIESMRGTGEFRSRNAAAFTATRGVANRWLHVDNTNGPRVLADSREQPATATSGGAGPTAAITQAGRVTTAADVAA
jgi:predicted ABC-type ATPase